MLVLGRVRLEKLDFIFIKIAPFSARNGLVEPQGTEGDPLKLAHLVAHRVEHQLYLMIFSLGQGDISALSGDLDLAGLCYVAADVNSRFELCLCFLRYRKF